MGKHKTAEQSKIMLEFMEENADIAKGFYKGDKVALENKWKNLTQALNGQGPPTKTTNEWKKTWVDWKCEVRRKLAHNKREAVATGGGPFKKHTLSEMEETVARITGQYTIVEGVSGETTFGTGEQYGGQYGDDANENNELDSSIDEQPSTSHSVRDREQRLPPTPKRRNNDQSLQGMVKKFMVVESAFHKNIEQGVSQLARSEKENESSLRRINRNLEKVNSTLENMRKDFQEHHLRTEAILQEKNKIKLQQLEVEKLRLEVERSKRK